MLPLQGLAAAAAAAAAAAVAMEHT